MVRDYTEKKHVVCEKLKKRLGEVMKDNVFEMNELNNSFLFTLKGKQHFFVERSTERKTKKCMMQKDQENYVKYQKTHTRGSIKLALSESVKALAKVIVLLFPL